MRQATVTSGWRGYLVTSREPHSPAPPAVSPATLRWTRPGTSPPGMRWLRGEASGLPGPW